MGKNIVTTGDSLRAALAAVEGALAAAGCPDAAFDAGDLCLLVTGENARLVAAARVLSEAEAARLNAVALRRVNREPLQYIWGRWPFLNFELAVGEGVLCPRADTEIVVELAAQCLQGGVPDAPKVLELCGGTGCIGLGIKMFCPTAQVTVLEKSEAALHYLRQNAAHALDGVLAEDALTVQQSAAVCDAQECAVQTASACSAQPYINVVEGDLFTYHVSLPDAAFDLLISNPPYLTAQEMTQLQPEVACEPAMALAAGADGLDFYRAIASDYQRVVKEGGFLVLEIGCAQAAQVTALLAAADWCDITCHQDYGKNDRCIIARRIATLKD